MWQYGVVFALLGLSWAAAGNHNMIALDLCKYSTGEQLDIVTGDVSVKGPVWVDADTVHEIMAVNGVACSLLSVGAKRISVIGTPAQIWCKLNRGPGCP